MLRWMVEKLVSRPAEPALVDVVHPAARRFGGDDVLCLPLGADEQQGLVFRGELPHVVSPPRETA